MDYSREEKKFLKKFLLVIWSITLIAVFGTYQVDNFSTLHAGENPDSLKNSESFLAAAETSDALNKLILITSDAIENEENIDLQEFTSHLNTEISTLVSACCTDEIEYEQVNNYLLPIQLSINSIIGNEVENVKAEIETILHQLVKFEQNLN